MNLNNPTVSECSIGRKHLFSDLFGNSKGKLAVFSKRTALLLAPIPCLTTIISGSSGATFGNIFSVLLSDDDRPSVLAAEVAKALTTRPLPSGISDYGTVYLYNPDEDGTFDDESDDDSNVYEIEQHSPLHAFLFDDDYEFRRASINDSKTGEDLSPSQVDWEFNDPKLKFTKQEIDSLTKKGSNGEVILERYEWSKEDFLKSSLSGKGDLNLVIDVSVFLKSDDEEQKQKEKNRLPITSLIDLNQLLSVKDYEIHFLSVKPKNNQQNLPSVDCFFKFSKETKTDHITLDLVKKTETPTPSKKRKRDVGANQTQDIPIENLTVRSFFVFFTENPSLSFEHLFTNQPETLGNGISSFSSTHKLKKIFLDRWLNGSSGLNSPASYANVDQSKYKFEVKDGFWNSSCVDPYKVGGFIDADLEEVKKEKQKKLEKLINDQNKTGSTWVEKQMSIFEPFNPGQLTDIEEKTVYTSDKHQFYPTTDFTTQTPCSDMDDETKKLFNEFIKVNDGKQQTQLVNEVHNQIDKRKIPSAIQKLLNDEANTPTPRSKSYKVVQGSFRAWGGDYLTKDNPDHTKGAKAAGLYNPHFENSHISSHTFSLKIEKETLIKKLIEHSKLEEQHDVSLGATKKKLNELPEISSLIQVNFPYSFSIYDPVSNYLKKQKVNLNVELDLKSVFNQSRFVKEFFVYDIGIQHKQIGLDFSGFSITKDDKKKPYGLSGSVAFSAGLFLDSKSDLNVELTANVKGFVNTKNPSCDLRDRQYLYKTTSNDSWKCSKDSDWKQRKHNHLPPFIVFEIDQDPQVSSFYSDRRISPLQLTSAPSQVSPVAPKKSITTLAEFKTNLDNRTVKIFQSLDQTNNGEVYFELIDGSNERSKQTFSSRSVTDEKPVSSGTWSFWSSYYYIPRRNEGSIAVTNTEDLKTITLYLEGAASLAGVFFKSNHFNTEITKCSSEKESTKVTFGSDCFDGLKYESVKKDKKLAENTKLITSEQPTKITISWDELKKAKQESDTKTFNFQTIIHKRAKNEKGKDTVDKDTNKTFDELKSYLEYVFKKEGSIENTPDSSKTKYVSLVGVWYTIDLWFDENTNQIKYYTKIRPISVVSWSNNTEGTDVNNTQSPYIVGASAKAGFQLSKLELEYENKSVNKN